MIFETAIYALNAFRFRVGGATSFRPFPSASPAPASPPYRQLKLGRGGETASRWQTGVKKSAQTSACRNHITSAHT